MIGRGARVSDDVKLRTEPKKQPQVGNILCFDNGCGVGENVATFVGKKAYLQVLVRLVGAFNPTQARTTTPKNV